MKKNSIIILFIRICGAKITAFWFELKQGSRLDPQFATEAQENLTKYKI